MAVNIQIIDVTQKESRETRALKDHMIPALNKYFKNKTEISGNIIFYANNLFMLSPTKEVDILMVGEFDNFQFEHDELGTVQIERFCTVIEAKSHDVKGITFEGQTVKVSYSDDHDALDQLKKEMDLMAATLRKVGCGAWVTALLWLHGTKKAEIAEKKPQESNIIAKDLDFEDMIHIMLKQSKVPYNGFLNCAKRNDHFFENVRRFFEEKKKGTSIQTIKSLNLFDTTIGRELYDEVFTGNDIPAVFKGRAGTGKTISLLQLATFMSGEKMHKCLFLTYNTALVADIRRMLSHASYIHRQGIDVMSMEKYFRDIMIKNDLWEDHDDYQKSFNQSLEKALKYLQSNTAESGYDYIFIDEAHDWRENDKKFLLAIFDRKKIIVADGIDQFIRSGKRINWGDRAKELTVSMRQKSNIVAFVNSFSEKFKLGWNVMEGDLCGGSVEIHRSIDSEKISAWMKETIESFGTGYDILLLVPPELTEETIVNGRKDHRFKLIDKYAEKGIKIFDGTCKKLRDEGYPDTEYDMIRLYEYASCRGLEGWTTVCLRFDKYIESRLQKGDSSNRIQDIVLESLIPLTRAVNTLIITLSNPDGAIGKVLKAIAEENPGAVFWKIS